jgi:hypothetical protein
MPSSLVPDRDMVIHQEQATDKRPALLMGAKVMRAQRGDCEGIPQQVIQGPSFQLSLVKS